jgi:hypothetical protein
MGEITISYEPDNDLIIFTVTGEVSGKEILDKYQFFMAKEPTKLVIWDITGGTLSDMSSELIRNVSIQLKKHNGRRKGRKTALVCPSDIDYGPGRMFMAFAEIHSLPYEIQVFRDIISARKYLGINQLCKV